MTDNVFLLSCPFFRRFFLLLLLLPFQAILLFPPHTSTEYISSTHESRNRDSVFFTRLVGWLALGCLHPFVRCSICWQTRLFRAGHKGTMMSYFVNGRRVRLIESNLGRRSCFFVISHGASYNAPSSSLSVSVLSANRLERDRERVALLATFGVSFFFFFFFFTRYDGSKKKKKKGVGRSMSIFFYFFDSSFDEWRIRLFEMVGE